MHVAALLGNYHLEIIPRAGAREVAGIDGLQQLEGVHVVWVRHETDVHPAVGGAGLVKLERQQCLPARLAEVDALGDSEGVGAGGGVEVEGTGAFRVLRGADIRVVGRVVGVAHPAVREVGRAAAACTLEAFRVGQLVGRQTAGAHADGNRPLRGGRAAVGAHKHLVVRVFGETGQGGMSTAHRGDDGRLHGGAGRIDQGHVVGGRRVNDRPV